MKDQLIKLLSHLGISATRFADEIGVQRSSISHILSGRNKPSYDFIIRILEKYPAINPGWLLTGNGDMLNQAPDAGKGVNIVQNKEETELFDDAEKQTGEALSQQENKKVSSVDISKHIKTNTNVNRIEAVILLYTDGTFRKYETNE